MDFFLDKFSRVGVNTSRYPSTICMVKSEVAIILGRTHPASSLFWTSGNIQCVLIRRRANKTNQFALVTRQIYGLQAKISMPILIHFYEDIKMYQNHLNKVNFSYCKLKLKEPLPIWLSSCSNQL